MLIGGGTITTDMKKKFEKKEAATLVMEIRKVEAFVNGNYENLNEVHYQNYQKLTK